MPLKVSYDHPNMAKGVEVLIAGTMVPNGGSVTLSEAQERNFMMDNRMTVRDAYKDSEHVKVDGTSEISGGLKTVFGTDLDKLDITDTSPVDDSDAFDRSPATSVGESIQDVEPEPEPAPTSANASTA